MRLGMLVLLSACELDVTPRPPTTQREPAIAPARVADEAAPAQQVLDVTAREYGSNEPLYGVTVELVEDLPCLHSHDDPCTPRHRRGRTDDSGLARFELPFSEEWHVDRIAEPGYLTECPGVQDDDWHHRLVIKHHDAVRADYTCMLVPRSALRVGSRAAAIQIARAAPDAATWLRGHRDARITNVELQGIRWQVWFTAPATPIDGIEIARDATDAIDVVVDALDERAYVDVRLDPYGDYLPAGASSLSE
jgi:hypothetical protein